MVLEHWIVSSPVSSVRIELSGANDRSNILRLKKIALTINMLNWKVFNFLIATFIIRVRPRTESDNSTKIDIHPDTE